MTSVTIPSIQMKTQQWGGCASKWLCSLSLEKKMYILSKTFLLWMPWRLIFFGRLQKRHRSVSVFEVLEAKLVSAREAEATSLNLLPKHSYYSELTTGSRHERLFRNLSLLNEGIFLRDLAASTSGMGPGLSLCSLDGNWVQCWDGSPCGLSAAILSLSPDLWSPV